MKLDANALSRKFGEAVAKSPLDLKCPKCGFPLSGITPRDFANHRSVTCVSCCTVIQLNDKNGSVARTIRGT